VHEKIKTASPKAIPYIFTHKLFQRAIFFKVQAASTMNQSDIRGLVRLRRPEPTVIFFVKSHAFYSREFGSKTAYHRGTPHIAFSCLHLIKLSKNQKL